MKRGAEGSHTVDIDPLREQWFEFKRRHAAEIGPKERRGSKEARLRAAIITRLWHKFIRSRAEYR